MPHGYEVMVGQFKEDFIKEGYSNEEALKKAKEKAAKIWNSEHPDNPVHPGYDKMHGKE